MNEQFIAGSTVYNEINGRLVSDVDASIDRFVKAYKMLHAALVLCDWTQYFTQITLSDGDVNEILYYSNMANDRDYPLCCIIRGILFDQVPELYQILK